MWLLHITTTANIGFVDLAACIVAKSTNNTVSHLITDIVLS